MNNEKCTLSNDELIAKAYDWVSRLARSGGKEWCLRVPVDFNNDPDMLFIELCDRLSAALNTSVSKIENEFVWTDELVRKYASNYALFFTCLNRDMEMGKSELSLPFTSIEDFKKRVSESKSEKLPSEPPLRPTGIMDTHQDVFLGRAKLSENSEPIPKEPDWKEEIEKCKASPYYYATNYLTVNGKKYQTTLSEEEYNAYFNKKQYT